MTRPSFEPFLVIGAGLAALAAIALGVGVSVVYAGVYAYEPPEEG
jgi:hypothetical protein